MVKYSITMAIRMACIGMCLVVQGWWLLVFAAGAVILPYIAVILANAVVSKSSEMERPELTPRMLTATTQEASESDEDHSR